MRTVLAAAKDEAVALRHPYIGTEHLLLGLLDEGEGVAITVLTSLGVDLDNLRAKARALVARGKPEVAQIAERRFTSRAMRTLTLADAEARAFGHRYIATEHLLLGIVEEAGNVAWHALRAAGVRADAVRPEVERVLGASASRAE